MTKGTLKYKLNKDKLSPRKYMTVSKATLQDSPVLASLLNSHFLKINQIFGYNKLKSGHERLENILSERIRDEESQFKYFVLKDNQTTIGFVNIMLTKDISEILVLLIMDEYRDKTNTEMLLNFAIEQFKVLGIKRFLTEVNTPDEIFRNSIINKGANIVSAFYEINL